MCYHARFEVFHSSGGFSHSCSATSLIKYSHRRRRAYAYLMSLSNEEMGNIMEFMCAQYSIVNGVLRRLISFSREHRTPRQLLQFWAAVARDMSEAATIDISYLLNDHGRVVTEQNSLNENEPPQ